jgi:hypothetical protein
MTDTTKPAQPATDPLLPLSEEERERMRDVMNARQRPFHIAAEAERVLRLLAERDALAEREELQKRAYANPECGDVAELRERIAGLTQENERLSKPRLIDGKFHVAGSQIIKTSSGEVIPEDEPLVLMRGRDRLMVATLLYYRKLCVLYGCNDYQLGLVDQLVDRFTAYASDPRRMKQPGVTRGAVWNPDGALSQPPTHESGGKAMATRVQEEEEVPRAIENLRGSLNHKCEMRCIGERPQFHKVMRDMLAAIDDRDAKLARYESPEFQRQLASKVAANYCTSTECDCLDDLVQIIADAFSPEEPTNG